ncbi:hypothetical protein [Thiomicrospira microaerophila]|uniref:hypothetical protein n=1 Tax=Thiomicrospira microaerophila TaxID=406020 RepID=UPI0005CB50FD|nr:hypothetical protein [Thiomicrospira microaerophila]
MTSIQGYIPPSLPLQHELETKAVLKKAIAANTALAKLNGVAVRIPIKMGKSKYFITTRFYQLLSGEGPYE